MVDCIRSQWCGSALRTRRGSRRARGHGSARPTLGDSSLNVEVREYVIWRRADAMKNAITMAANTLHSHKFLTGRSTTARLELLRGTKHENLPAEFLNGRLIVKVYRDEPVTYTDRRTNLQHSIVVTRGRWVARTATDDTLDLAVTPAADA